MTAHQINRTHIALDARPTAYLIALGRADEAFWSGSCKGRGYAYWTAVASRLARRAEAKGEPY
jgi:hypothetical protein